MDVYECMLPIGKDVECIDFINSNGLTYKFDAHSNTLHVLGSKKQIDQFQKFYIEKKCDNKKGSFPMVCTKHSKDLPKKRGKKRNFMSPYIRFLPSAALPEKKKRKKKKSDDDDDDVDDNNHSNPVPPQPTGYNANVLANIYGISGQNQQPANIAIIELAGGYYVSDLNQYWTTLGFTTTQPKVNAISVNGNINNPGVSNADSEVVLDIEVVGGVCPNSNIYVYFTDNTDAGFYQAIQQAISDQPTTKISTISISWGSPENEWEQNTIQAMNSLFQTAANNGITICVAAGDNGSSDGEGHGNHVDFPASSPWCLACGGTRLVCPTDTYSGSGTLEEVWGTVQGNGAGGGGFSQFFPIPTYQTQAVTNYLSLGKHSGDKSGQRGVPDICGDADPTTGWNIYIYGSMQIIGGTSAVAPMMASYLASIGCNQFINPILYSLYQTNNDCVHDITIGNEGTFQATKGWDPASGLGSPNGSSLTSLLSSKFIVQTSSSSS